MNTYWPVVLRITITIRSPPTTNRAREPKVTDVNPRQSFEWDVLQHPDLTAWFDMLRDSGWYRDPRDLPELHHLQRRRVRATQGQRHPRRRHDAPGRRRAHPLRQGHKKAVIRTSEGHITVADVGEDAVIRHDAHAKDPGLAFALSRLSNPSNLENTPIGVFRDIHRPSYDRLVREQINDVIETKGRSDLQSPLHGNDTWTVA